MGEPLFQRYPTEVATSAEHRESKVAKLGRETITPAVEIRAGAIVRQAGGGPSMTVSQTGRDSEGREWALCDWVENWRSKSRLFAPEALIVLK